MKKTKRLFALSAFFAAGLIFAACTTSDDAEGEQEMEQGVVKAEFTISFPQQMGGFTRQSTAIVQEDKDEYGAIKFRGIQNIELRPFSVVASAVDSDTPVPSKISLGATDPGESGWSLTDATMTTLTSYTGEGKGVHKSHLYKDIEIAIGTRSFMFSGVAIPSTGGAAVNGSLTRSTSTPSTLEDITYSPTKIYTNGNTIDQEGKDIATYLTKIAEAGVGGETTLTLFPNFKNVNTGSWNSVKAVVQKIYSTIFDQIAAGNLQEAIAAAITKSYTFDEGTSSARTIQFASDTGNTGTLTFNATLSYPQNIKLPDGAAYVAWEDNKFNALANDNLGKNIATLDTYAFPAALYYYGLSDIKTAAAPMESKYVGTKTWKQILDEYDAEGLEGKGTVVQTTTQSIAIVKEIQYAVSRLDVTVSTQGNDYLNDFEGNKIDIAAGTSVETATFPITGIIVANQRPVDYKFEATSGTEYTVYDSQVTANIPCLFPDSKDNYPASRKTHTLVLQTLDANADAANSKVKIAVEFQNNSGKTIIGRQGELIYPGTKFYLIGVLDPADNTTQTYDGSTADPTNHPELIIKKAFVQDYVTTAQFVVKSFQNAYNMLPDMRSPKLEIGMSVDLTWKTGITQETTIE